MQVPDRLYHTGSTVRADIKDWPQFKDEITRLREIIKSGSLGYLKELDGLNPEQLQNLEYAIKYLLDEIEEMRKLLPLRNVRVEIREKLIFLNYLLHLPLILADVVDDEEYSYPQAILESIDVKHQLVGILRYVKDVQKFQQSKNSSS